MLANAKTALRTYAPGLAYFAKRILKGVPGAHPTLNLIDRAGAA